MKRGSIKRKKGQVWVETVIYTLIAFALIGTVLGFVKPKIDELKDKSILEQQVNIFIEMDSVIKSAMEGPAGNTRNIELAVKKGKIIIDCTNNELKFEMESKYEYTDSGIDTPVKIVEGISSKTTKRNKIYDVILTRSYSNYDLQCNNANSPNTELAKSSNMYTIQVQNKGSNNDLTTPKAIANFKML